MGAILLWFTAMAGAQITTDVLGSHNMGPGGQASIKGNLPPCLFCHPPHSGLGTAETLWGQKLSTVQNYTLYSSDTLANQPQQPVIGQSSNLCLSCHDGTVAPGQTTPWGTLQMVGSMQAQDVFGQDLSSVHPFNFKLPLQPASNLIGSVVTAGVTGNPAVKLIGGNVQCITCHDPHVQSLDASNAFLVINNSSGALCLACHVSSPSTSGIMAKSPKSPAKPSPTTRGVTTEKATYSGLTAWSKGAHAQSAYRVSKTANVGPYETLHQNSCLSCHSTHKGQLGGALLSRPKQPVPNLDAVSQNCRNCHNGGSAVSPAIPNVYQEFAKAGHPFPVGTNEHQLEENTLLNKNRHATCTDCHEPHASQKTSSFVSTELRPSQNGASGISASDGVTVVSPAVNQYEICFRCHGTSSGKQTLTVYGYLPTRSVRTADSLNLIPPLSQSASSSHPVLHDRNSPLTQPSLLNFMWNLDGRTRGRMMGARLLCTDCHNSDDNREFGGTGPNGPHGSQYAHILERRYEFSRVAPGVAPLGGPGTTIQNLLPPVTDPSANGPYALCAKCHDLSNVLSNASFRRHSAHINAGFSCSVCHTAHGVPAASAGAGERLVDFDIAVVAQNDASNSPIAYDRASATCTLKCHNYNHSQNGTVTPSQGSKVGKVRH